MIVLEATRAIREKTSVLKLFPKYITGEVHPCTDGY